MSVEVTVNWQPALNVCRCCLNDCCYKDISTEYYWMGQKEVYADMLSEVFGLTISYQDIGPGSSNRLICEDCITRLRDATTFKKQVIESEKNFLLHIQKRRSQTNNVTVPDEKVDLKVECPKSEEEPESSDDGFDQDIGALDDDSDCVDVKVEQIYEVKEEEEEPVKKPPKRKTTTKAYTRRKRPKLSDTAEETNDEPSSSKKNKSRRSKITTKGNSSLRPPRQEIQAARANTLKIIENSNMCAFQWNRTNFRCYCCKQIFLNINLLREHTDKHPIEDISNMMIMQKNKRVKVEISSLQCKICSKPLDNLKNLKEHITDTHNVLFDTKIEEDLLIPFNLNIKKLECQLCTKKFNAFRQLNVHMNTHYQTKVCEMCGAGFTNMIFLKAHKKNVHSLFRCHECDVIFPNNYKKYKHDEKFHNKPSHLRHCPNCPETFRDDIARIRHLINVHDMETPEYRCSFCDKVFIHASILTSHTHHVHLKERKYECDVCKVKFFTKSDLKRHTITHTREKNFHCNVCGNSYASRDSLRNHMKKHTR